MLAAGLALGSAISCLAVIGAPPPVRIDSLWVNDHIHEVRLFVASIVAALAAGGASLLVKRNRLVIAGLWIIAIVVTFFFFWERAVIVMEVVAGQV
jgi:hypothetical protein